MRDAGRSAAWVVRGAELAVDVAMRRHRHVLDCEQLTDSVVVIGGPVRHQHAEQRFVECLRLARKAPPSDRM